MRKRIAAILGASLFWMALAAQVQNINIGGSFSGSFLLSGSPEPYQVAGSPYLSESWMYGTIEMKSDALQTSGLQSSNKRKAIEKSIRTCDQLIEKISDPRYQTEGIALILKELEKEDDQVDLE